MKLLLSMPAFSFFAILVLLSCMACQKSFGIEPGFYSNFPGFKDAKPKKLLSEIGTPNQRIEFYTPNRIEIPPIEPSIKRIGEVEVKVIDELIKHESDLESLQPFFRRLG
ncbi:MAG: hypothetical protein C0469_00845 [Cyanobacteria bacterium DS2.3.42]|nr:hypothetical protein [Cyanobacteria bacterium DS2.3.42]